MYMTAPLAGIKVVEIRIDPNIPTSIKPGYWDYGSCLYDIVDYYFYLKENNMTDQTEK